MRSIRAPLAATLLGTALLAAAPATAEEMLLRYASPIGPKTSMMVGAQWWMDRVTELTGGEVKFRPFYAGALVGARDTLPALRQGRVDLAYIAPVYTPAELPLWMITSLPFITDNAVAQSVALSELDEADEALAAELEGQNIKPLLYHPIGPAATVTGDPMTSPEDLAGRSLRAVGLIASAMAAAGAEPVATDPTQIYESLQRKVLDGAVVTFDGMLDLGLAEVAPNVTHTLVGTYASAALAINLDVWNGLPDNVKQAMTTAADEYSEVQAAKFAAEADTAACEALKKLGGSVTVFGEEQVAAWRDKVRPEALETWKTSAVEQNVPEEKVNAFRDAYLAAVRNAEGTVDYRNGMSVCADR